MEDLDIPSAENNENNTTNNADPFDSIEKDDALSAFNKEWAIKLETKRQSEMKIEEEMKCNAGEELNKWQQQRAIKLQAKKDSNRSEQQVVIESIATGIETGRTWDRVMKLIDSSTEIAEKDKSDVSRMRNLFIHLKNDKVANN